MSVLSLMARLGLDGSGFKAGIKEAEVAAHGFGKDTLGQLKGQIAAAFTVGAVLEFSKGIIEMVKHIKDASEQFGISTRAVQEWDQAGKRVGLSMDEIGTALIKIGAARQKAFAEGPASHLAEVFAKYGVTFEEINDSAKTNNDLLQEMVEASGKLTLDARDRREFDEIAGKKAEKLLAFFQALADIKKSGGAAIVTDEDIEKIHKAEIAYTHLWDKIKAAGAWAATHPGEAITAALAGGNAAQWWKYLRQPDIDSTPLPFTKRSKGGATPSGEMFGQAINPNLGVETEMIKAQIQLEWNRLTPLAQQARLREQIADNLKLADELLAKEDVSSRELGFRYKTEALQKQIQLEEMLRHGGRGVTDDSLQRQGNQLGNAFRIMAGTGGVHGGSDTQKQISLAEKQVQFLALINEGIRGGWSIGQAAAAASKMIF